MNQSTADRFIAVMAKIQKLAEITNDEPMLYEMRKCREQANAALDDAINMADNLTNLAQLIHDSARDAIGGAVAEARGGIQ